MKQKSPRWFLIFLALALLPLVLAGLFVLVVRMSEQARFDPTYFSAPYIERYNTQASVALGIERAVQTGDQALVVELQGVRRPMRIVPNPDFRWVILYEVDSGYYTYLYFDIQTFARTAYHVEEVGGRWVLSPTDARYYLRTGRWVRAFGPLASIWWSIEIVTGLMMWFWYAAARYRASLYEGPKET